MEIGPQRKFAIRVERPFDWQSLLAFLRLRATPGVEVVTDSAYRRTITDAVEAQAFSVAYDPAARALQIAYSGEIGTRKLIEARAKQIFKPDVNTVPIEAFLGRETHGWATS